MMVLRWMVEGSWRRVGAAFGVSAMTAWRFGQSAEVRALLYVSTPGRMGLADREEISRGLVAGLTYAVIGERIGRAPSTVCREVNRNGGREEYRAAAAHAATLERGRRPKPTKLSQNPVLAAEVERCLEHVQWSPEQISHILPLEFPDDPRMRIAAETIYQALYVYGRGGLRTELCKHLRSRRSERRSRPETTRNRSSHSIPDLVPIAERPDEVAERIVAGHWEGDLIMGRNNKSQVLTLVERVSGLVLLGKLDSKHADVAALKLQELIMSLPAELARTVTWDRGTEMADHTDFTIATDVKVYFCDPYSPWQRGSNENTNGLLRQYLPRNEDLSRYSQDDLNEIAAKLNRRPRKRHDWQTPAMVLQTSVLH